MEFDIMNKMMDGVEEKIIRYLKLGFYYMEIKLL